jgi:hypothetical protein
MCPDAKFRHLPPAMEGRMTSVDDAAKRKAVPAANRLAPPAANPAPPADHAGSVLCRLLIAHPEVVDIEILGQLDLPEGIIYSLGVKLPGGRELLIDVGDV